jgi:hypothetical protein
VPADCEPVAGHKRAEFPINETARSQTGPKLQGGVSPFLANPIAGSRITGVFIQKETEMKKQILSGSVGFSALAAFGFGAEDK